MISRSGIAALWLIFLASVSCHWDAESPTEPPAGRPAVTDHAKRSAVEPGGPAESVPELNTEAPVSFPTLEPPSGDPPVLKATGSRTANASLDGKNDLVWRNVQDGRIVVWQMEGGSRTSNFYVGNVSTQWRIVAVADHEGHGRRDDLVWRNRGTGEIVLWVMDGTKRTQVVRIGSVRPEWEIVGSGNFEDAGSRDDLLWRNRDTGDIVVWLMEGPSRIEVVGVGNVRPAWKIRAVGDFEETGTPDDLVWRNPNTGGTVLWLMVGTSRSGLVRLNEVVSSWEVRATGDYQSDGFDNDIVWRNANSGRNVVWEMDGASRSTVTELAGVGNTDWRIVGIGELASDEVLAEASVEGFEVPETRGRRLVDPYESRIGASFTTPVTDGVVGIVENLGLTSACVPPESADQVLGTGVDQGSIGRSSFVIDAVLDAPLSGGAVTAIFQSGVDTPVEIRLLGSDGSVVASKVSLVPSPGEGLCPTNTEDDRNRVRVTVRTDASFSRVRFLGGFGQVFVIDDVGISGRAPVPTISEPEVTNTAIRPDSTVRFRGTGFDGQEGELGGNSLTWISSQDGVIGTGSDISVTGLSRGIHRISLQAEDGDGNRGFAERMLEVGSRWEIAKQSPPAAVGVGPANSVSGTSASNVFVAGGLGVLHYDGTSWTRLTLPLDDPASESRLTHVWAATPDSVFIVGDKRAFRTGDGGATWTNEWNGTSKRLWAVHGNSPSHVYAVGDFGVVTRFDGQGWSKVIELDARVLVDVWVSPEGEVFAVGYNTVDGSNRREPLIFHFDGRDWRRMSLPVQTGRLQGVWGTSRSNVFAVGTAGILHWDGFGWGDVDQEVRGNFRWIHGAGRTAHAVGFRVATFDRGTWRNDDLPLKFRPEDAGSALNDVFVAPSGQVFAVAGDYVLVRR